MKSKLPDFSHMTEREQISALMHYLPEEIKQRGDHLRDLLSGIQWEAGSITHAIYTWVVAEKISVTLRTCCYASLLLIDGGEMYSPKTVERHYYVVAFWAKLKADGKTDERSFRFPFSHLQFAAEFQNGRRWKEIMKYDMKVLADTGKKLSQKALEAHFNPTLVPEQSGSENQDKPPQTPTGETFSSPIYQQTPDVRLDNLLNGLSAYLPELAKRFPNKARILGVIVQALRLVLSVGDDIDLSNNDMKIVDNLHASDIIAS